MKNQDPDAEFTLAELYETGDLVEKDLIKSKELYNKAREHGSLETMEELKKMN
ncbi:SEL1-like repeat protein [Rodentibacter trehalosifermentans]|uniref:SEL1-like repeat protein n=1 Tax=Rodentibacter trehalosifermentans TaxID=1908263 RepID=UPI0013F65F44|nr:SEL1-like repeat protein [Rodentibacter trehalosifermentans]